MKKIYPRSNRNSYIQLQTTRKLALFHGNLSITKMHRGRKGSSYISFLLNPERRLDVIPVRIRFCESLPQARQPISHRKVCVNHGQVNIPHFKVTYGDMISLHENEGKSLIRNEEIRGSFYIKISVEKRIGKFQGQRQRMWGRTKREWFRLLKSKKGCVRLLKSRFLQKLRSSMRKEDLERTKKFGSKKVCLGSSVAEHSRMKSNLYQSHFKFLSKKKLLEKKPFLPIIDPRTSIVYNSALYTKKIYCSASSHKLTMKTRNGRILRSIVRADRRWIVLPTHCSEVDYRTRKAAVSCGPNIFHIPHDIRLKDPNLPLRSAKGRGQNI